MGILSDPHPPHIGCTNNVSLVDAAYGLHLPSHQLTSLF